MTIRTQLTRAIADRGLSVLAVARLAGVSQPGLSKWLNGKQATITLETVEKVAAALGLDLTVYAARKRRTKNDHPIASDVRRG